MAKDAIELIIADHRAIGRILDQLSSGKGDRATLAEEVGHMLTAHSRAEEEHVYPAIAQAIPGERTQVRHSEEEHERVEQIVHRLRGIDPQADEFDALVEQLVMSVNEHVQTEEDEILPALRRAVDKSRLEELGAQFNRRRNAELQQMESRGGDGGGDGGGQGGGQRTEAGLSRAELYSRAQQADVPGRSQMKKDELAQALEEQQGLRRKGR